MSNKHPVDYMDLWYNLLLSIQRIRYNLTTQATALAKDLSVTH